MGGAASCRSIFVIFSRKLQALKARQNTGNFAGTRERREREFSHADLADYANFMGGAASCRSIFVIFSRKLQALKARQNTGIRERGNAGTRERGNGGNGNFLTQIPQIAQILWEERHLAAPFLLFFLANSKR